MRGTILTATMLLSLGVAGCATVAQPPRAERPRPVPVSMGAGDLLGSQIYARQNPGLALRQIEIEEKTTDLATVPMNE